MSSFGNGGGPLSAFEGGLFGGRDPFAGFGGGAMEPFGGGFGSIMKQFDDMSGNMQKDFEGNHGSNGVGGNAVTGMGNGQYACQSFSMCSRMGPDGKMHTERFANSEVGNRPQGIREAQQAYQNSSTGVDKMALERQLGDRGRKVVRERDRTTNEERTTELFKGMNESGRDAFCRDFGADAQHMPAHPRFDARSMISAGAPSGRSGRGALEAGHRQNHSVPSRRR